MLRRAVFCILYLFAIGSLLGRAGGCATASHSLVNQVAQKPQLPPEDPLPIPLIELSGDAQSIGSAHGAQLATQIRTLEKDYLNVRLGSENRKMVAYTAASMFETTIAPEHRQEIISMAKSSGMDPRTALLAQCFLDLTNSVACSTVALPASASPDGIARMGRNLDFPSLDVADKLSVVLIYRPTGKYQFAAITWPGFVGVVSGMNEHGLTLCNMEVPRSPRFPQAMPYPLLYRTILERCRDVNEAIAFLRDTSRQSANNLMLMDAAGNRAVVEIKPESIEVRQGVSDRALLSTNHQRGQDESTAGKCWRYDLLHSEAAKNFGTIGVREIEQMLASAQQGKNGSFTIQSMVFEPSNRVIYLATGSGAAKQKFYRVDLSKHFIIAVPKVAATN